MEDLDDKYDQQVKGGWTLSFPEEACYDAYGAVPLAENERGEGPLAEYNYIGGHPSMLPEQSWPTCNEHGPMSFLWSMTDQKYPGDGEVIQFYMCCRTSIYSWLSEGNLVIRPRIYHSSLSYNDRKQCYHARRFRPRAVDMIETSPPVTERIDQPLLWPKRYLQWKKIRLYDEYALYNIPLSGDDYRCCKDGTILSEGDIYKLARLHQTGLSAYTLLHRTRGIFEQEDHPDPRMGYIVMPQYGKGLPISNSDNTSHLNLSHDLILEGTH